MPGAFETPGISTRLEYRRPPDLGQRGLGTPVALGSLGHWALILEAADGYHYSL
jgi:hypothetical protein